MPATTPNTPASPKPVPQDIPCPSPIPPPVLPPKPRKNLPAHSCCPEPSSLPQTQTPGKLPPAHAPKITPRTPKSESPNTSPPSQTPPLPARLRIAAPEKTNTLPPAQPAEQPRPHSPDTKAQLLPAVIPDRHPPSAAQASRSTQKAAPETPAPEPCRSSNAPGSAPYPACSRGRHRFAACAAPRSRAANRSGSSDSIPHLHRSR